VVVVVPLPAPSSPPPVWGCAGVFRGAFVEAVVVEARGLLAPGDSVRFTARDDRRAGSGGDTGRTSAVALRDFRSADFAFAGFVLRMGDAGLPVRSGAGAGRTSIAGTSVRIDALQSSAAPAANTPRMRRARIAKRTRRIMPAPSQSNGE
jgi:hypothetical protein